ncbi:uncharacterized protein FIESC28_04136 [Fusarium coffeatum]|uniref:Zn(2)-C6 fungal-type domain-containing protein n=1 Tax=Fusarium coffeatum TaxID=231269 RepID=A0A366S1G1_9HYPO|nr:uncharacterized protein FIESC28_04136 [Fusarium coffeatum]RBR23141.1 hypothetical protein FIESC28_04136 [Fusarium coffeatum]
MTRTAGRPSTSCNVCKRQKIRCSGDRPSCTRCVRLKSPCHYNKGGVNRVRKQKEYPDVFIGNTASSRSSLTPIVAAPHRSIEDTLDNIPSTLLTTLVNLYFTNVYQSTLLFHKPTFLQSLSSGTVRQHVLLSICAWGANFYRDEQGKATLKDQGFMIKWAKKAGSLVFQDAEDLNEDNIVTHCNLSLFWHSQGSWRISYLHKGNACQLLHIIGAGQSAPTLESQLRRRRFWECYLMHCFSSEKLFRFEVIADVESLPLPWPEDSFEAAIPPDGVATIGDGADTGSVFAELIRGLHLWCSVVSVVRWKDTDLSTRIQQIFKTESEITTWWQRVPDNFRLDASTALTTDQNSLPIILLTNLIYHQSLCVLHSSIVPLFCWSKGDNAYSSARHLSAQIAYEHACTISSLVRAVSNSGCPFSSMPIFVAYAAYSSCAVQIPFLWCSQPGVKAQAQLNVQANMNMIQEMSSYWKLASLLQVYARCIHDVHKRNPPTISNEPKHADISAFVKFGVDADLAKASILEFTGILRADNGGYVKPGEESHDLTINSTTDQPTIGSDRGPIESSQDVGPSILSEQAQVDSQTYLLEPSGNEWPTFDVFNSLFDADITALLPLDDTLDLSAFDFNFSTLDNSDNI